MIRDDVAPRPWRLHAQRILDARFDVVFDVEIEDDDPNAILLVRAVNAHDDLVLAARSALSALTEKDAQHVGWAIMMLRGALKKAGAESGTTASTAKSEIEDV